MPAAPSLTENTMQTVHAIFENGVYRPTEPVDLPDKAKVEFEPRVVAEEQKEAAVDEVYRILSQRFDSGHHDTAARHNEHQP
jgi:predicted DNA-binding antitoxin AbrB/MazE fold protein